MKNEALHKTHIYSREIQDPIIRRVLTENGKSLFSMCMFCVLERMVARKVFPLNSRLLCYVAEKYERKRLLLIVYIKRSYIGQYNM